MIKKWRHCIKPTEPSVQYPLLYFSLTEKETLNATNEILLMIEKLKKYVLERDSPFCMLVNTEEMGRPAANVVMHIVNFMREIKPYAPGKLKGSVIVIQNTFIRGLINLCFSIQSPTTPVFVVSGMDKVSEHFNIIESL